MGPADLTFIQITPALLFLNRKHHKKSICSERSIPARRRHRFLCPVCVHRAALLPTAAEDELLALETPASCKRKTQTQGKQAACCCRRWDTPSCLHTNKESQKFAACSPRKHQDRAAAPCGLVACPSPRPQVRPRSQSQASRTSYPRFMASYAHVRMQNRETACITN